MENFLRCIFHSFVIRQSTVGMFIVQTRPEIQPIDSRSSSSSFLICSLKRWRNFRCLSGWKRVARNLEQRGNKNRNKEGGASTPPTPYKHTTTIINNVHGDQGCRGKVVLTLFFFVFSVCVHCWRKMKLKEKNKRKKKLTPALRQMRSRNASAL